MASRDLTRGGSNSNSFRSKSCFPSQMMNLADSDVLFLPEPARLTGQDDVDSALILVRSVSPGPVPQKFEESLILFFPDAVQ